MKKIVFILYFVVISVFAESVSIYELPTSWFDQNGKNVRLSEIHKGPVVIGMVYTSCPHACPMTISKMQVIRDLMKEKGIKNVRFVLASFDYEKDKADKLLSYMKTRDLNPKEWTFLAPKSEQDARELSVVLGISYRKLDDGHFSHSNVLTLLDSNGLVKAKLEGLSTDPTDFIESALRIK